MNCQDAQTLMHAYLDGELDLANSLEVERHLRDCPACAPALQTQQALRAALQGGGLYQPAPAGLAERLRASLRPAAPARPSWRLPLWRWAPVAAAVALAALLTWGVARTVLGPADDLATHDLLASHVRSLQIDEHRFDRKSSDQHVVKPWFQGKVNFAPDVKDLKDLGFPLIGGRLDYVDGRRAAVLVYQRRRHVINLFQWKADPGAPAGEVAETRQGFHLVGWTRGGLTYWAVSDLNPRELREFARLVRQ